MRNRRRHLLRRALANPAQLIREIVRGLPAAVRILGETPGDDAIEPSLSVDVSVNVAVRLLVVNVKFATGAVLPAETVTDFVTLLVAPPLSVTVSCTLYVPPAEYVLLGFVAVDVVPSPKFQLRDAIVPSLSVDVSVKLAVRPLVENE